MVLGLDLSLRATGYHALTPDGSVVHTGVIEPGCLGLARLDNIARRSFALAKEAELVVIEGFSYGSTGQALFQIAGLGYLVRHALWMAGIKFVIVAPVQLKKFVAGKAKAEKSLVLREVYKRYGFDASDDNEADAAVLAHIGRCLLGHEEPMNEAQREVLQKVKTNG